MSRPPVLPALDWKEIFASGRDYAGWLDAAESPEQRDRIEANRLALGLDPQVQAFLADLPRPVHVVAIAEDWCGDVVRHVPALQRMAESARQLRVRYISRQQWPDVFARFLTNGGEAIPKFIFLNEAMVECGNWGPMPDACRELIARGKACGDVPSARRKVGARYQADPELRTVVAELVHLVSIAACLEP